MRPLSEILSSEVYASVSSPLTLALGKDTTGNTYVTDLGKMPDHDIDMQTTVIIGNSKTFVWNDLMITPRGYERKMV